MGSAEKFCLRWNDFERNISVAFQELREDKDFFDVTLACDDDQIQAHKVILSACSPFFRQILKRNKHEHPLLYLKGVKYIDLMSVLNFMYHGEVNVAQDELNSFLAIAEDLKVKGLTQNKSDNTPKQINDTPTPKLPPRPPPERLDPTPPPPKRQRPHPVPEPMIHIPLSPEYNQDDDIQEVVPVKSEPISHLQEPPSMEVNHSANHIVVDTAVDNSMAMYEDNCNEYETYEDGTEAAYDGSMMGVANEEANKGLGSLESYMSKVKDDTGTIVCFTCNCCQKTMARKDHMKNHIQTHFPQQDVACELCGTMCKNIPSLKVHVSKFHRKTV